MIYKRYGVEISQAESARLKSNFHTVWKPLVYDNALLGAAEVAGPLCGQEDVAGVQLQLLSGGMVENTGVRNVHVHKVTDDSII